MNHCFVGLTPSTKASLVSYGLLRNVSWSLVDEMRLIESTFEIPTDSTYNELFLRVSEFMQTNEYIGLSP